MLDNSVFAVSLSSLIYHNNGRIYCPNDLIQIMDVGNQLYSRLAHSASFFALGRVTINVKSV